MVTTVVKSGGILQVGAGARLDIEQAFSFSQARDFQAARQVDDNGPVGGQVDGRFGTYRSGSMQAATAP